MTRRLVGEVVAALAVACLGAASARAEPAADTARRPSPAIADGAFVRTAGDRFLVGDAPFHFVGANLAVVQGERERAHAEATIAAAAHDGITVGRIWALGEGPVDAGEWYRRDHLFRAGPDGFIEASYAHLDRVLAAARAAGVRVIVTLANHWHDYGGVPMYLRWAGLDEAARAPDGSPLRDAFYSSERARAYYLAHVDKLLSRTNTVTGVRYVDDPTIFAWELMNESDVATPSGAEARRAWIVDVARHIKARDPHHLVASGVAGYMTRAEREEWIRVHRLPEIDYCDAHLYPQTTERVRSFARLAELVDDRAQLARFVIHKPLLIGEYGFHTSGRGAVKWLGLRRAEWFGRFLERVFADGAAGALAWIYQPWLDRDRDFGIYVDRASTDDVRQAIERRARALSTGGALAMNARLGPAVGSRFLYDPLIERTGPSLARPIGDGGRGGALGWRVRDGSQRVLELPVDAWARARWEQLGVWAGGRLVHAYGAGGGRFDYRFVGPLAARAGETVVSASLEVRLSSEWPAEGPAPGSPEADPARGGSTVKVTLDGLPLGTRRVATDDGGGRLETFPVEGAALARLSRPGPHTLGFEVADEEGAHGLCIYGAPTGRVPPGALPTGELGPPRLRVNVAPRSGVGIESRAADLHPHRSRSSSAQRPGGRP